MTLTNALKKLAKAGLTIESTKTWDGESHIVKYGGQTLAFYSLPDWQDETKIVIDLINITDSERLAADTNMMNGNCYTTYYDNFTQAIKSFVPTGKAA